jgi:hypothetical protein
MAAAAARARGGEGQAAGSGGVMGTSFFETALLVCDQHPARVVTRRRCCALLRAAACHTQPVRRVDLAHSLDAAAVQQIVFLSCCALCATVCAGRRKKAGKHTRTHARNECEALRKRSADRILARAASRFARRCCATSPAPRTEAESGCDDSRSGKLIVASCTRVSPRSELRRRDAHVGDAAHAREGFDWRRGAASACARLNFSYMPVRIL